ncbi:hypothetical protein F6B41_31780, partial [Microbacterium lushaniae]
GQGNGLAGLVADQAATITAAIPIISDAQPEVTHSPQDPHRGDTEQQQQQQQAAPATNEHGPQHEQQQQARDLPRGVDGC